MALETIITRTIVDYTTLTLVDSTGDYNVTTNPTGWGAPNIALTDVLYAHLVITTPSLTVFDIDIIGDLGLNFATVTSDELIYSIPSSLLGQLSDEILIDGVFNVEYQISTDASWVDGAATNYTNLSLVPTWFTVQQQVFENIGTIPNLINCSKCCNIAVKDINTQFLMLQALIYASSYAYLDEFNTILTTLQQILSFDLAQVCNC
jgi:hypothetical protein